MRVRSEAQNNFTSCPPGIGVLAADNSAISDPSCKVSLIRRPEAQPVAYPRA